MGQRKQTFGLAYRWVIWGIMVLSFMVVFFHRLAAGVVRPYLESAFGLGASSFGLLASMYFYAYMVMQIPVGILADSLGARKTVSAGMLLAGVGSLVFATAHGQGVLMFGRFLVGIGVSTVFICILKIQSRWFREREFATMSGCTNFIGNLGGVMAQAPLAMAVATFSWRTTFAGIGVFSLGLGVLCYILIRNAPSDMGLPPINETQTSGTISRVDLKEIVAGLITVLKCWRTWPNFIFLGCLSGIYLAFSGAWGVSFLREVYGMDGTSASMHVAWVVYGVMAGGFFTGWISDRLGRRRPPLVGLTALSMLAWAVLVTWGGGKPPLMALKPLFFVIGFSATAYILSWALAKETQSPRFSGVAISVVNMGGFLGTALITMGMGQIIGSLHAGPALVQYRAAFTFCLACSSLALVCTFLMPETRCRNITLDCGEPRAGSRTEDSEHDSYEKTRPKSCTTEIQCCKSSIFLNLDNLAVIFSGLFHRTFGIQRAGSKYALFFIIPYIIWSIFLMQAVIATIFFLPLSRSFS